MTRLHFSNQPEVATSLFLDDCSDDSGILAIIANQNVLLPKESTGQTFLTPTASTAVDTRTGSVSDVCGVDNDDEPWLIEPHDKSGRDTRFKGGVCRCMPNGVVYEIVWKKSSHRLKQRACREICVNFSLGHWNTIVPMQQLLFLQRETSASTFVAVRRSECEELSRKGSKKYFVKTMRKIRGDRSQNASHITSGFNE